jgi:acetyltransferase-like isoleucine patch superfamily enzyme
MILPGVTVKKQAIVAAHSVVTKDVPENSLVTGSPAAVVRPRKNEGKTNEDLGHVWLADGAFQTE